MAGFVFKTALSSRGGGTPAPADFTAPQEELDIQEDLRRRIAQGVAPRFSPQEIEERVARNQKEYELGLIAMLSGNRNLQGAGGLVLKKALADREPVVSERGVSDPLRGTFQYHQGYLQEQYQKALEGSQARVGAARERWDTGRQSAAERAARDSQHMEMMAAIQANKPERGNYQPTAIASDGSQLVTNSNNGMTYKVTLGANGQPVYTPYLGVATPKAQVEKAVAEIGPAAVSAVGATDTQQQIKDNPNSFGAGASFVAATPGLFKGWAAALAGISPKDQQTRANVLKKAAMETNALYGAAQSAGELKKAAGFMPDINDPDEQVLIKNAAARDWFKNAAKAQGPTVAAILVARNPELMQVFEDDPPFLAALRAATPNAQGQVNTAAPAGAPANPLDFYAANPGMRR